MPFHLFPKNRPLAESVALKYPVLFLVLAFTMIPVELKPDIDFIISFETGNVSDIIANILGYVPIGFLLGDKGLLKASITGALISIFAELCQLVMLHRDASIADVITNLTGTFLGVLLYAHWSTHKVEIRINHWLAILSSILLVLLGFYVHSLSGDPINQRGLSLPGFLEAQWKPTDNNVKTPFFDGKTSVYLKHSSAYRLAGSMTMTAWINSGSYPEDDASIISQLGKNERGYQLDTTLDTGQRAIGFKLTDACGKPMARYGMTKLMPETWYHVTGVYNAPAQTLDVYLNGKLDNGFLLGSVTTMQRSSRSGILIGSRENFSNKFNFIGSINDVRIYSLPLNKSQIASVMNGHNIDTSETTQNLTSVYQCGPLTDNEDKMLPGIAALIGVLIAFAVLCAWPAAQNIHLVGMSFCAGILLLTLNLSTLPPFNFWLLPLVSMLGGLSIAISIQSKPAPSSIV
jgi:Concanavalin A-like lectin/glucanases superfamily/VanZ like family